MIPRADINGTRGLVTLPRADINGTRPVVYVEASSAVASGTDARQDASRLADRIALGQQLQASVQSKLEDGKFLVKIADTTARMALPNGTQVGDSLRLTLIDTAPRMTFLLGEGAAGQAGSATLSSTGRLIDHLLHAAQLAGASTTVAGKTPILGTTGGTAAQISSALYTTLAKSGLFYESHLNEWLNGQRSLTDLLAEPQNKLGADGKSVTAQSDNARLLNFAQQLANGRSMADLMHEAQLKGGNNDALRLLSSLREWTDGGRSLNELMQALRAAGAEALPMNAEAARLVNQQLDALERQRFMWQGELWPGQDMDWEVSRDAPDGSAEDAPQTWQSVVRFELPTLGAIAATINLVDDRVYIQVRAASEETANSLREHGSSLIEALKEAGSPLDLLTVKRDEEV